jgi:hypothetical protein
MALEEQLTYKLADTAFASTEYTPNVPIHKREPSDELCVFRYRPSKAPNEPDDHYFEMLRTYELAKQDLNRALDDNDIYNLKRVLIERLSGESSGVMTERSWSYRMAFKVWETCGKTWLTCWLE